MQKFIKKALPVIAVQLNLDTEGFAYEKWGGTQTCKQGDWIVNNDGETYTIDADTFFSTYAPKSPGLYVKVTPVWAKPATVAGSIETKEGATHYAAGDILVFNNADGTDGYAMAQDKFASMYEIVDGSNQ